MDIDIFIQDDNKIFELMNDFFLGNLVYEDELYKHIIENPFDLQLVQIDMSVYAYAAMLSLECLKQIHAAYSDLDDTTKIQLENPWNIQGTNGYTALHYVAESNLVTPTKYLITDIGVDVETVDNIGNTALHIACYRGYIEIVKLLLYSNASKIINITNNVGLTPLGLCIRTNNYNLAALVLKYNPIMEYDFRGYTYDLNDMVEREGSIEMKQVFKKHFKIQRHKKRSVQKKRKLSKTTDVVKEYEFLCITLNDTLDLDAMIELAEFLDIKLQPDVYYTRTKLEQVDPASIDDAEIQKLIIMKENLCKLISQKLVKQTLYQRLKQRSN